ncbi:sporulation protein YqfD [uncultured Clostridium sp.]|nr:sporulation protein YqfD [uncultured Clostridium sp.]
MNRFEKFREGSVKVRIEGRGIERFFNIAAQRGIMIEKIETKEIPAAEHDRHDNRVEKNELENEERKQGKTVCFQTSPKDFKRLKAIARKTNVLLRITEKHGFPFLLILGRRRSLWVGGLAAFFLLICLSSFYVWDISFEGNHRFTDETLLHFMATVPVQCGMRKSRISCTELEKRIRNAFPEISWVSAELTGTRLTIHLRENNRILQARLEPESPCELTAGTDGTVTRIIVRNGKARVKVGDTVKAGDVLVSGELPLYDDFEALVKINKVHADAEVYAKTTRTVEWKCPETKEIRARTGKRRRGIFFKFLDLEFCFLTPGLKKENTWELFMEEFQLKLSKNFYLPVYGGILTAEEYVPYEKVLTEAEISESADRYLNEYLQNFTEKGIQILGSDVRIERSESHWTIHGTLTVVEDIAKESPIPEDQEEIQTVDEHH